MDTDGDRLTRWGAWWLNLKNEGRAPPFMNAKRENKL